MAVTAIVLSTGLLLASCAGTSNEDAFSAYVADHWPHWAGGMPADVPPRPGAPGYQEFIAHGQANRDPLPAAGPNGTAATPGTPIFQTAPAEPSQPARAQAVSPAPPAQAAPAAPAPVAVQAEPPPAADDSSVVHGGLY